MQMFVDNHSLEKYWGTGKMSEEKSVNLPLDVADDISESFAKAAENMKEALLKAVRKGDVEKLKEILQILESESFSNLKDIRNEILSATDSDGSNLLFSAAFKKHMDVVDLLLDVEGIDVTEVSNSGGFNLLIVVIGNEAGADLVEKLLGMEGVDANATSDEGYTALIAAATFNNIPAVEKLLEVDGIDVTAATDEGDTALSRALEHRHPEIANMIKVKMRDLHPQGKALNAMEKAGFTPDGP